MPTKVEFTNQLSGRNQYEDLDHIVRRFEWKIKKAHIVTAYWDYDSLNSLISFIKSHRLQGVPTNIEVYVNKVQLESRRQQLIELDAAILEFCENTYSGIYVLNTGFMHVKAFQFEGQNRGVLVLGSANLTKPGLTSNEEVIIEIPYSISRKPRPVRNFEDFVNYHFDSYENEEGGNLMTYIEDYELGRGSSKTQYLRDFFDRGKLWYDATAVDPFRFPLNLPEEIRQGPDLPPEMANMLDTDINDSLNIKQLIRSTNIESVKGLPVDGKTTEKATWRKWTVETTLGRWSPQEFEERIWRELAKNESKKDVIIAYANCLKHEPDSIEKSFLNFIEAIARFIINQKLEIQKGTWAIGGYTKYENSDQTNTRTYVARVRTVYQGLWRTKVPMILKKLQNERFIDRLATLVSHGPMPDIWEQEDLTEPFLNSFVESLNYYIEVGNQNQIAKEAKKGLKQGAIFDDIQEFDSLCLAPDSSFLRLLERAGR